MRATVAPDPAPLRRRAEGRVRSAQRAVERPSRHLELRRQAQSDGWLAVSLSDNGLGMPPAVVERLRNCLEHPGEIAGIHGGPIGLGLPTAMSIARLHGGRLEIREQRRARTTVSLLMPPQRRARPRPGPATELPPSADPPDIRSPPHNRGPRMNSTRPSHTSPAGAIDEAQSPCIASGGRASWSASSWPTSRRPSTSRP